MWKCEWIFLTFVCVRYERTCDVLHILNICWYHFVTDFMEFYSMLSHFNKCGYVSYFVIIADEFRFEDIIESFSNFLMALINFPNYLMHKSHSQHQQTDNWGDLLWLRIWIKRFNFGFWDPMLWNWNQKEWRLKNSAAILFFSLFFSLVCSNM